MNCKYCKKEIKNNMKYCNNQSQADYKYQNYIQNWLKWNESGIRAKFLLSNLK